METECVHGCYSTKKYSIDCRLLFKEGSCLPSQMTLCSTPTVDCMGLTPTIKVLVKMKMFLNPEDYRYFWLTYLHGVPNNTLFHLDHKILLLSSTNCSMKFFFYIYFILELVARDLFQTTLTLHLASISLEQCTCMLIHQVARDNWLPYTSKNACMELQKEVTGMWWYSGIVRL